MMMFWRHGKPKWIKAQLLVIRPTRGFLLAKASAKIWQITPSLNQRIKQSGSTVSDNAQETLKLLVLASGLVLRDLAETVIKEAKALANRVVLANGLALVDQAKGIIKVAQESLVAKALANRVVLANGLALVDQV